MMRTVIISLCVVVLCNFIFSSCQDIAYKPCEECEYYEVQGVITQRNPAIIKGQRHLTSYYFYFVDTDSVIKQGSEKYSEFAIKKNVPVVIMINENDSLDMYVGPYGIINTHSWKLLKELIK